jgi:hypothetical protein
MVPRFPSGKRAMMLSSQHCSMVFLLLLTVALSARVSDPLGIAVSSFSLEAAPMKPLLEAASIIGSDRSPPHTNYGRDPAPLVNIGLRENQALRDKDEPLRCRM